MNVKIKQTISVYRTMITASPIKTNICTFANHNSQDDSEKRLLIKINK